MKMHYKTLMMERTSREEEEEEEESVWDQKWKREREIETGEET